MKEKKLIYIAITTILAIIISLPDNNLSSFIGISGLITSALGYFLGAFVISIIITLIILLFNRSIRNRFWLSTFKGSMIVMIIANVMEFLQRAGLID
jgi:hypothetical protein